MLVSTNTHGLANLKDLRTILRVIKKAGFDAYDYSMFEMGDELNKAINFAFMDDYKEKAIELRKYADSIGLVCNQAHAIFPSFFIGNEELTNQKIEHTVKCMEIASILGAKIIVVHPENHATPEQNRDYYKRLEPYCIKYNIKIGVENMWNRRKGEPRCCETACSYPDNYVKHMQLLDSPWFVACVDIGHAEMMPGTSAPEIIRALGGYVKALHVHDNNRITDDHRIPYCSKIDFEEVIKALRDINYQGDITLEVEHFAEFFPNDEEDYQLAADILFEAADKIRKATLK
jgi:sugar phosphate isomerase/epimerase